MEELYEHYITGDEGWNAQRAAFANVWRDQTFTPLIPHRITSLVLKISREGLPGALTVSVRATDALGQPTGPDLCSGTTEGNDLPTSVALAERRKVSLGEGFPLDAAMYSIALRAPSGDNVGPNWVLWRWDDTSPTYPRGIEGYSRDGGVTWTVGSVDADFIFEEWGYPIAPPDASFLSYAGGAPLEVVFEDASTGGLATNWLWDFGDGSTSTEQNPTHIYPAPGTYLVTLTVAGPDGNTTISSTIEVVELPPSINTYVIRPVTDQKILPDSVISAEYLSQKITVQGCPGQYIPASFVVRSLSRDLTSLMAEPSTLTGPATIPSTSVDIRVVKCWYQAGRDRINEPSYNKNYKELVPELLLKNDSLVRAEANENYLVLPNGELWISDIKSLTGWVVRYFDEYPISDSDTLQPVDIPVNINKQFWVTIKIPEGASPGIYSGTITLTTPADGVIGEIQLNLEVLPITLLPPYLIYSIYYDGSFSSSYLEGTIHSRYKNETQIRAELLNLREHGVTNPASSQYYPYGLERVLQIRSELGMGGQPLYYNGEPDSQWGHWAPETVQAIVALAQSYGITEVYFYGEDEARGDELTAQRSDWEAIKAAGGKIFAAGVKVGFYTDYPASEGNFGLVGDLQDLMICAREPDAEEAARWHSLGKQIFCYNNPQVGLERPETYRRNFGLLLWQRDYDGAMDFAYQWSFGEVWNDFDHFAYKDHNFTYPTMDGVIDTIEWEGFREGVTDIRYLTTLLNEIELAKSQFKDTSVAENYLATLKATNLSAVDLDVVRQDITSLILELQAAPPVPTVTVTIGIEGQGTTDPPPGIWTYAIDSVVSVAALPLAGYQFVEWQENGALLSTDNPVDIVMSQDRAITAIFEEIVIPPEEYAVTISVIGQGITEPPPGAYTILQGDSMTIIARPASGYQFDHWEGDISGTNTQITFQVTANMSVIATFSEKPPGPAFPTWIWGAMGGIVATAAILLGRRKR